MNETHQLPCLKRKLVHGALWCIWSVDKKQIRQTQCMELFIVPYQGGVLLPRNVIDVLQPLESDKYQHKFDPGGRELVSTCEKNKSPSQDHNKLALKLVSQDSGQMFSKKEGVMWIAYGSNGGWLMHRVDAASFI